MLIQPTVPEPSPSEQVLIFFNYNHADMKWIELNKQSLEPKSGFYLQWMIGMGMSRLEPIRHSLANHADADTTAHINLSK